MKNPDCWTLTNKLVWSKEAMCMVSVLIGCCHKNSESDKLSRQLTLTSLDFVAWTIMLMCHHPEKDVQPLAYEAHPNVCIATPTSGHV